MQADQAGGLKQRILWGFNGAQNDSVMLMASQKENQHYGLLRIYPEIPVT